VIRHDVFFLKQINKLCATTVEYNIRDKYNDNIIMPKERCSKAPIAFCSMDARVNSLYKVTGFLCNNQWGNGNSFFDKAGGLTDDLFGTLIYNYRSGQS